MNPVCLTLILMETVLLFRINLSNGYEPNLLPVPDMTALVTLRDKPLGGNDSMPTVQARYRIHAHQFLKSHLFKNLSAIPNNLSECVTLDIKRDLVLSPLESALRRCPVNQSINYALRTIFTGKVTVPMSFYPVSYYILLPALEPDLVLPASMFFYF